jgi:hypothetical protein
MYNTKNTTNKKISIPNILPMAQTKKGEKKNLKK